MTTDVDKPLLFDFTTLDQASAYKLLISAVIPRPVAFVSTLSAKGVPNLAPFSFFNAVASEPPTLMISVSRKRDGSKKDTLRNIEETRQFVVNSANEWLLQPLNQCSAEYPYGVSEFEKVGLTPAPSLRVKTPRVKESALAFECELDRIVEIGEGHSVGSTSLILGRILTMQVAPNVIDTEKARILPAQLKPLSRLGGISYARLGEVFELPRPKPER